MKTEELMLLLAAGGGAYFLWQKQKNGNVTPQGQKPTPVTAPGGGVQPLIVPVNTKSTPVSTSSRVSTGGGGGGGSGVGGGLSFALDVAKWWKSLAKDTTNPIETAPVGGIEPGTLGKVNDSSGELQLTPNYVKDYKIPDEPPPAPQPVTPDLGTPNDNFDWNAPSWDSMNEGINV